MRLRPDDQHVFVVQLPSYVVDRWREARETTLAKLTVEGGDTPSVSLTLEGSYAHDLPKDYVGKVSLGEMRIFEESDSTTESAQPHISVSGPVVQMKTRVTLTKLDPETGKMELDKNVMRLVKEKDAEEKLKVKSVAAQELSIASGRDRMQPLPSVVMRKRKNQLYSADKDKKLKRARCDRSDLERMLFDLFEQRQRWRLQSLQQRTDQPMSWLKEVLNDLADLHHSGPYNGMYELKPEYNKNTSAL